MSNVDKSSEGFDYLERSDLNYSVDLCKIAGDAMSDGAVMLMTVIFWAVFIGVGIRLGLFTPGGIAAFFVGGAIVGAVIVSGFVTLAIVGGVILVISALVFLALRYGKPSPVVGMNNGNDRPCDPNWKPVEWRPSNER